jgi:hypothetical protein
MFVVSNDGVSVMTLATLANAFVGGMRADEITIFFDEDEADEHFKRLKLTSTVSKLLPQLSTETLERLADTLQTESIDNLLSKMGV